MGAVEVLGSMATRDVLDEIATAYRERAGVTVQVRSMGGVEAARRIAAGERFDVVVLAEEAIATLEAAGHVVRGSRVAIAQSGVAVAVRSGAPVPDLSSEPALRSAILAAPSIGLS